MFHFWNLIDSGVLCLLLRFWIAAFCPFIGCHVGMVGEELGCFGLMVVYAASYCTGMMIVHYGNPVLYQPEFHRMFLRCLDAKCHAVNAQFDGLLRTSNLTYPLRICFENIFTSLPSTTWELRGVLDISRVLRHFATIVCALGGCYKLPITSQNRLDNAKNFARPGCFQRIQPSKPWDPYLEPLTTFQTPLNI